MRLGMKVKNQVTVINALKRLQTKVDNMRLEFKATGHPRKYDMDELSSLIDTVKRNLMGATNEQ
tara:strand:+ start:1509 stop:1700 length:192 start_codon:yes stop_codon:yes gene_type:complete